MQNNATLTCHFACQMGAVGNRHSTRRLTEGHKCDPYGGHLTISNKITNTHNLSQWSPFRKCTIQTRSVAWARSFTVTECGTARVETQVSVNKGTGHTTHTTAAGWAATEAAREVITLQVLRRKDLHDTLLSEKGKVQKDVDRP